MAGYITDRFRHQVLIVLVPVLGISGWRELIDRGETLAIDRGMTSPGRAQTIGLSLEFIGVLCVLVFMPVLLRFIWRTAPMGEGALRDRLIAMCDRCGVRCRGLLVWMTHGMMINGAVIGVLGAVRYILLTDGLLEEMEEREVEAVMAHEIGHVVWKHIIWLMASLIISSILAGAIFSIVAIFVIDQTMVDGAPSLAMTLTESAAVVWSLGVALLVFGFVSRRFERQADAFAVRMFVEERAEADPGASRIVSEPDSRVMIHALDRVAELNDIPKKAFMWRHGSIRSRQIALARLVGQPIDSLSIDRDVRTLKRVLIVAGFIAAVAIAFGQ